MDSATDLFQAEMSETSTSGVEKTACAGVAKAKEGKLASPEKNVYSIKQEVMDGVDINIKKEPLDSATSANDFVKIKPLVPPEKDKSCGLCASSFTTASNLKSHIFCWLTLREERPC